MDKFLFILPSTVVGGAETQAINLAKSLSNDNLVEFLCFHINEERVIDNRIIDTDIKIRIVQVRGLFGRGFRYFKFLYLLWFLSFHSYTYIFPYLDEMNLYVGLIKYFNHKLNIIWNQRDADLAKFSFPLAKRSIKNYNGYISNSNEGANFLINKLDAPKNRTIVINNGVLLNVNKTRQQWRSDNGYSETDFLVCMLANLQVNKDHITLLKAWKSVETQIAKCHLLLVGYKGSTYSEIVNFIQENKLKKVVIFGKTNSPAELLNSMDVSILSSKSEGLSNTMLESLFLGIPFIGTKIEGITSVLGHDYPFLFNYMDNNALIDIILRIYNDKSFARNVAKKCQDLMRSQYFIEALHDRTIEFLKSTI